MEESQHDRTEQATPFKLSEAKKKGQVAKSLDFNTFVVVVGLLLALNIWGASSWLELNDLCARLFRSAAELSADESSLVGGLADIIRAFLSLVLPFSIAGAIFAILANLIQTGPVFSGFPLTPKFERLNPIQGLKRIFNKRILFEALKSVIKLVFFTFIVYGFFSALWPSLPLVGAGDPLDQISWLGNSTSGLLTRLALALLVVGLLDLAFSRRQFSEQMKMSRRDVKEEVKRREGDPLIRAKIRELQKENLKQARSMGRVGEADVLITNPNHYAIALRYVPGKMNAPCVIAKGADTWALEMKILARKHSVIILEHRRLARKLFRYGQLDRPVPADTFIDVARIYADLGARERASRYEVAS